MSTRPKAFLKQSKSKPKKEQILETADDFQADFEDAAGKWRAGDPIKSMRFFQRAIAVYDQGLQLHPQSFDLAYNKARVQLEIATHPILVKQLQQPLLVQLQTALISHRNALALDENNPDVLFNTAQVLTTIAEEATRSDEYTATDAVQLLEEALQLQIRCLNLQEIKYAESQQLQNNLPSDTNIPDGSSDQEDGGASVTSTSFPTAVQGQEEDQWFSIVEPITVEVLIDSILAQLNTLSTLCGVISSSPDSAPSTTLAWTEDHSSNLINDKLPPLTTNISTEVKREIAVSKLGFVSAMLEAGYRTYKIDIKTYKEQLDMISTQPELEIDTNIEAILLIARSRIAFNSALVDTAIPIATPTPTHTSNFTSTALSSNTHDIDDETRSKTTTTTIRWTTLSTTINQLTKATKLPNIQPEDVSQLHFLRGDISMLQWIMSKPPTSYNQAISNANQLLKNAEIFYRNASRIASQSSMLGSSSSSSSSSISSTLDFVINDIQSSQSSQPSQPSNGSSNSQDISPEVASLRSTIANYKSTNDKSSLTNFAKDLLGKIQQSYSQIQHQNQNQNQMQVQNQLQTQLQLSVQKWMQFQIKDMVEEGLIPEDFEL